MLRHIPRAECRSLDSGKSRFEENSAYQYMQFCAASPILENLMMRLRNLTGATVLALGLNQ